MTFLEFCDFVAAQGEWLTGGEDARQVAENWACLPLDLSLIVEYIRAGVFDRDACDRLAFYKVAPMICGLDAVINGSYESLGYWYSNGDISITTLQRIASGELEMEECGA